MGIYRLCAPESVWSRHRQQLYKQPYVVLFVCRNDFTYTKYLNRTKSIYVCKIHPTFLPQNFYMDWLITCGPGRWISVLAQGSTSKPMDWKGKGRCRVSESKNNGKNTTCCFVAPILRIVFLKCSSDVSENLFSLRSTFKGDLLAEQPGEL